MSLRVLFNTVHIREPQVFKSKVIAAFLEIPLESVGRFVDLGLAFVVPDTIGEYQVHVLQEIVQGVVLSTLDSALDSLKIHGIGNEIKIVWALQNQTQ